MVNVNPAMIVVQHAKVTQIIVRLVELLLRSKTPLKLVALSLRLASARKVLHLLTAVRGRAQLANLLVRPVPIRQLLDACLVMQMPSTFRCKKEVNADVTQDCISMVQEDARNVTPLARSVMAQHLQIALNALLACNLSILDASSVILHAQLASVSPLNNAGHVQKTVSSGRGLFLEQLHAEPANVSPVFGKHKIAVLNAIRYVQLARVDKQINVRLAQRMPSS